MTKQELESCVYTYGKDIYSFCKYLTCSKQEADDLYQDTFLTAIEQREKIDITLHPKSYLLSIALRIWKNKKRKYAWRKRIVEMRSFVDEKDTHSIPEENPSPEQQILQKEELASVRLAVNQLPDKQKVVVLLFYMEDLSTAQIAQILNIPQGTVLSRLHQARKRLQHELEDLSYE